MAVFSNLGAAQHLLRHSVGQWPQTRPLEDYLRQLGRLGGCGAFGSTFTFLQSGHPRHRELPGSTGNPHRQASGRVWVQGWTAARALSGRGAQLPGELTDLSCSLEMRCKYIHYNVIPMMKTDKHFS